LRLVPCSLQYLLRPLTSELHSWNMHFGVARPIAGASEVALVLVVVLAMVRALAPEAVALARVLVLAVALA